MKNKRGQDVSPLPVIIGAVLLLVGAVFLIIGLTKGWGALAFWIPQDNVQTIVTQCTVACTQQSTYNFCTSPRELKINSTTTYFGSCQNFSNQVAKLNKEQNSANIGNTFGVTACSTVSCSG